MASEAAFLRDDHGRKVTVGRPAPGTVTVNVTDGMTSVLASLSGERLAAFREAVDRAAMPGQEEARAYPCCGHCARRPCQPHPYPCVDGCNAEAASGPGRGQRDG